MVVKCDEMSFLTSSAAVMALDRRILIFLKKLSCDDNARTHTRREYYATIRCTMFLTFDINEISMAFELLKRRVRT